MPTPFQPAIGIQHRGKGPKGRAGAKAIKREKERLFQLDLEQKRRAKKEAE